MGRFILFLLVSWIFYVPQSYGHVSEEDYCVEISKLAAEFMKLRQLSEPITNMMEMFLTSGSEREIIKAIIQDAYAEPLWPTEAYKKIAVNEFSSKKYLWCLDLLKDFEKN